MTEVDTRTMTLSQLAQEASGCTKCRLANGRTQVVFGVGDPNADVMASSTTRNAVNKANN